MNEHSDINLEKFYEQQKSIHGKSATSLWIVIGIVLFIIEPSARFLSWQAAVYFIVGMFVAAIVFGGFGYAMQRVVAATLLRSGARSVRLIAPLAFVLYAIDAVLIFFAARWTIRMLFS